ncbi:MAG: SLBB domain-containing protein, partial [Bacteroidales bacterium]|nr:SLBB domain-containing protein [Bacteroidales bacterium]
KVFVLNKTVEEAKDAIQEKTDQILRNASVIVKLISFKFTVLGEVNRPGVYKNFNNQLTVLEAIGMAGDISDYGNRTKILVIRPTKNETRTYRIDLTKKDVLSSEGFFLLPNDIVYVEPIKSKTFRINIPTLSLFLSTLTTLILVLNFIITR